MQGCVAVFVHQVAVRFVLDKVVDDLLNEGKGNHIKNNIYLLVW